MDFVSTEAVKVEETRPSCHYYMMNIHVHLLTLILSLKITVISAGMVVADLKTSGVLDFHSYLYGLTALAFGLLLYGRIAKIPLFFIPVLYVWRIGALICIIYIAHSTRDLIILMDSIDTDDKNFNLALLKYVVNNTYMIVYCGIILFVVNIMSRDYDYIREVLKRPFVTLRGVGVEPHDLANIICNSCTKAK